MHKVIVIGGANVDVKGRSASPFIDGTSNPGEVVVSPGGVGRNIAENLARLGLDVDLLTVLGADAHGKFLRSACQEAGIGLSLAETVDAPTGVYIAITDDEGELVSALNDMRCMERLIVPLLERHRVALLQAAILVADCNLHITCLHWLAALAQENGIPLVIEPVSVSKSAKLIESRWPALPYAITPNAQQLHHLTGEHDLARGIAALKAIGFVNIVVHCGSKGAAVAPENGSISMLPSLFKGDVADVTGAGDAAVAGLVCGLADGFSLLDAARLGQAAAALKLESRLSVAGEIARDRIYALAGLTHERT